ncbi:MAG: outer membrane beta-barrel protein [Rhodospirillaceae bacterium]
MTRLFAACAAALFVSATAYAQEPENYGPRQGDWEMTLSGTGTSDNDFDSHTIGISGGAGYYFTDNVLVGARQSVNFAEVNDDDTINFATRVHADWVFDFGRWRPFVGVNFGGIYGERVNDTFAAGPEIGVKYYADRNTFIYGLGEYQFTFKDADDAGDAADDGQFYYTVGVGFNF